MEERNHLLTEGPLLNEKGNLCEAGYAVSLVKSYDRNAVKANKSRIKEWDYYYLGDEKRGLALTVADNSYMSMASASVLNFESLHYKTTSKINFFSNGKLKLPFTSAEGDVKYHSKKIDLKFLNDGKTRRLLCDYKGFDGRKNLYADITLDGKPEGMVIATPFQKNKHFYYNQKINCLKAEGYYIYGDEKYEFSDGAYGVLDWGRGVWTYKNTWYWSSLSTEIDGHTFGFNLGYGFGDTSKASENMLFYDGISYKLGDVKFLIPKTAKGRDNFLRPWEIVSDDKAVLLTFYPILDRKDCSAFLWLKSDQHQVFGMFSGKVNVGGKTIELFGQLGFAEKVFNKW